MKDFWDDKYNTNKYLYGIEPNQYFKSIVDSNKLSGKILCVAEGEGRNAVYAAKKGLEVCAFDISKVAKTKALKLAKEHNVTIDYKVNSIEDLTYKINSFDIVLLTYAHFDKNKRKLYHQILSLFLKNGGKVILEAFSKKNLTYKKNNSGIGGPDNINMLYTIDQIKDDFKDFKIIELKEEEVLLNEGSLHNGLGKLIRFYAEK